MLVGVSQVERNFKDFLNINEAIEKNIVETNAEFLSRFERDVCSVDSEYVQTSKSEASVPIDLTFRSVKKLVVELLAVVGLGLCSAAIYDVSYDFLFTASEFSVSEPWLVRRVKESGCKSTRPCFTRVSS